VHKLGDPSAGLMVSPKPIVAEEIVTNAEDLAPRKQLHSAAVDWHGRGYHSRKLAFPSDRAMDVLSISERLSGKF
jgi:hypothetical protein